MTKKVKEVKQCISCKHLDECGVAKRFRFTTKKEYDKFLKEKADCCIDFEQKEK